jgi:hypothetical protein
MSIGINVELAPRPFGAVFGAEMGLDMGNSSRPCCPHHCLFVSIASEGKVDVVVDTLLHMVKAD